MALTLSSYRREPECPSPTHRRKTLPGIQHRLSSGTCSLHIARLRGDAAGFALVATHDTVLELVYLAVAPEAWGAGIGSRLLAYVDDQARATGVGDLELWVIADNERAVQVYERSGWRPTDDLKTQPSTGRVERRLVKTVS